MKFNKGYTSYKETKKNNKYSQTSIDDINVYCNSDSNDISMIDL